MRYPIGIERKIIPEDVVERRAVRVPQPACTIGLDVDTLPPGISIIDVDDRAAALAFLAHLGEDDGLIVEKTPSGGVHIWGRGLKEGKKNALCSAGIRVEYFTGGRISIVGAGRELHRCPPLAHLGAFPSVLMPAQGEGLSEIKPPIPSGSRWNTLYEHVTGNRRLDRDTLESQARFLGIVIILNKVNTRWVGLAA